MAGSAHLGTNEHGLVKALVLPRVDLLIGNLLAEHLARVLIDRARWRTVGKRAEWFEEADSVGRKAK